MKTIPIILSVLAIGAFAAAPAEAKSKKHMRVYSSHAQIYHTPGYEPRVRVRDPYAVYGRDGRYLGRASDNNIRSQMLSDDSVDYAVKHY